MRDVIDGPRQRIAVDIDGTLTADHPAWWAGEWGLPQEDAIQWVKNRYTEGHTILLYTARPERARRQTKRWLRENGVRYHSLVMEKLSAHMYVDNRAVPALAIQQSTDPSLHDITSDIITFFDNE